MLASHAARHALPYYPAVRTITVEGRSVAYQDSGGAGPPVLLVHGLGSNLSFWQHTVPALTPSYRTLAIDLPGFGLSDKNDVPGTIDFFVETIARFLDALGIEQAHYVGLSMGGQVGLAFAQRYYHRVQQLALVSPAGFEIFKPHETVLIKSMTRYAGVLANDPASIRRNMTLNVARWRPAYQWLVTQRRALAERPDYAAYTAASARASGHARRPGGRRARRDSGAGARLLRGG